MTAYELGRQAGRRWALGLEGKHGRDQLATLEGWVEGRKRIGLSPWTDAAHLGAYLETGRTTPDPAAARRFWASALKKDAGRERDPEFLRGWITVALEGWEYVKNHMRQKAAEEKGSSERGGPSP